MSDPAAQDAAGEASTDPDASTTRPVIDLREASTTRVRVSRDDNPFEALSPSERMKLIIRVLCEIVAYGEVDDLDPTMDVALGRNDRATASDHPAISN